MLTLFLVTILAGNCAIHTPEFQITGERTALENQILGTYLQVQEDVWMVASVRAASPDSQVMISGEKRAVLEAIQNREFNRDDIEEFKRDGVVGENAEGLLEIRETSRYVQERQYRNLVDTLVAEENRDRKVIMERIISVNPSLQPEQYNEVGRVFARLNRDASQNGDWIQTTEGQWVRKGELQ